MLTDTDKKFLRVAYTEAKEGFDEGGCPIGSAIARNGELVSSGRNQRVQKGDPIAHGEMEPLVVMKNFWLNVVLKLLL